MSESLRDLFGIVKSSVFFGNYAILSGMTIQHLRVQLQDWCCGCGDPTAAIGCLRDILALHPLYNHREAFEARIPDEGLQYLVLYWLADRGLTEHGGTVGGGWLSDEGRALLDALNEHGTDVLDGQFCAHGYDVNTDELLACVECGALNPPSSGTKTYIASHLP